ncbi:nicotinate-nucleotide adenylyltransferase [Acetobacteraceae bacterium H6797]|nr:nicotinate-nucleotide adenylyltransferase [Acetobacteraceae bacterium H6797]
MGPGRYGDRRRLRIGLLGGSFNPAHEGHRHVAEMARRSLGLHEVWLMVSPGNPLKPRAGMAPFRERLASAAAIAEGDHHLVATDIEQRLALRYTADTLARLKVLFPRARFVWIIGADNLWQISRWRRWRELVKGTAMAVLPRPGWTRKALAGPAAQRLRPHRRRAPALLAGAVPDHAPWCLIPAPEHAASASAIRAGQGGAQGAGKGGWQGFRRG